MYGAILGDYIGSIYEFNNIKTKDFPLFSWECGFTDDTIMTIAVAAALLLNRETGEPLEAALVAEMQAWGRRYPASYGGMFSQWLWTEEPQPYNSFGNGSAMRVSPCGLIAKTLEEALELAEASAAVTHNHPEGIKGAQAVAAAIFLAKTGCSKEKIRVYTEEHFYPLDFKLDEIRPTYGFDETCQGSVPQAIESFLESESYEDAIRNAISIGGDSDTIAAIAGSIAWAYYGRDGIQPDMQAMLEAISLREDMQAVVARFEAYLNSLFQPPASADKETVVSESHLTPEIEQKALTLCRKYVVLMECLYKDRELSQWCRDYSAYKRNTVHEYLDTVIYNEFIKEAYDTELLPTVLSWRSYGSYTFEKALVGTEEDLIFGLCLEIRADYANNGSLIHSIGTGRIYKLMDALLNYKN